MQEPMPGTIKVSVRRLVIVLLLVIGAATTVRPSRLLASSGGDGVAQKSAHGATLKPATATSPDIPSSEYDSAAEQQLLDLANQDRAQSGAPRLTLDAGLSKAAREHAEAMSAARQLSHRFEGEPSLPQRLADVTHTQLDQEGENIALDFDAAQAEQHLMLSPPHRANLLNPAYNVVGLGVVRSGDRLYIVQDFGHALPNYSPAEVKERIAATVAQVRHQVNQPDLARRDLPTADDAACSMAQADKLGTPRFINSRNTTPCSPILACIPKRCRKTPAASLASHNLRSFSVGACYARTETYPTGVYWVVLALE